MVAWPRVLRCRRFDLREPPIILCLPESRGLFVAARCKPASEMRSSASDLISVLTARHLVVGNVVFSPQQATGDNNKRTRMNSRQLTIFKSKSPLWSYAAAAAPSASQRRCVQRTECSISMKRYIALAGTAMSRLANIQRNLSRCVMRLAECVCSLDIMQRELGADHWSQLAALDHLGELL